MMGYTVAHRQRTRYQDNQLYPCSHPRGDATAVTAEQACIRCGKCTAVCPADLLPQQLYWYARSGNYDAAQDYDLFDCIECGCCAYVCPSHIPLVQYYRHAKDRDLVPGKTKEGSFPILPVSGTNHAIIEDWNASSRNAHWNVMARKKQALSKDGSKDAKKAAIEAALERVKQKKAQAIGGAPKNIDNLTPEQQQLIDCRRRRRRREKTPRAD